jgi:2-polyprenyl-3-methyl-5-hydroxy-6-metoxy-1,4-benzoquinol methylase
MLDRLFPDLRERYAGPELMDLPDVNEKKLINTIRQFSLLNILFTRSRRLIKKYILADMLQSPERTYEFLDLGAGGCDIAIWLLNRCKLLGLDIRITCLDYDLSIVKYAREKCRGYSEIRVIELSVAELDKLAPYDYVFANHLLHHLPAAQWSMLIAALIKQTRRIFLLNDIRRSYWAYAGFALFAGIFMHNSFAFADGLLSIRKGISVQEMRRAVSACGHKNNITIGSILPARVFVLGQMQ